MKKGKITHTEAYNRVKDKPGVKTPHALAQHIVEQAGGEKVTKDDSTSTPFEDLTATLQDLCRLGNDIKRRKARVQDEDIENAYDDMLKEIRGLVEYILAGLSTELEEANYEE